MYKEKEIGAIKKLVNYIEKQNFKGYDPYDTLNSWFPFQRLGKWLAVLAIQFQKRNPINIRLLLGVKKFNSTKGMGLLLKAFVKIYRTTNDKNLIPSIEYIKNWLIENKSVYNNNFCWGYDYPYSTKKEHHEKGFPTVIHHSYIISGFFEYYKVFNDEKVKEFILGLEKFILESIPITRFENGVCLGYNPESENCCYNASLHAVYCLAVIDKLRSSKIHNQLIEDAINFVISKQKEDGVWYYSFNHRTESERKQIDFHQGFIIESIFDIKELLGYTFDSWENSITKGINYYRKEQFFDNGMSKWRLPKIYPVDIHNQSQGIITFSKLRSYHPSYFNFAKTIKEWTIENMQDKTGYFYYRKFRYYYNKIPYMRWSQSWMLLALITLIEKE
ncbi:MAG: hypothetical protein LC120_08470 [Bacteroidales bacterium]|nr:hypothetical protein [Bacteroidales bacterium]